MEDASIGLKGAAIVPARTSTFALLSLLMLANAFGYVDRQILTVLAIPISHDLGLTNIEIGMMSGLAFALFYAVCGIPLAWIADRSNRVWVLSASIAVWSLMTALCGMANSFLTLFAARIGVGIGEAGCTPPAHSLISESVPRERRASALAVYNLGLPLGSFAGLTIGGWLAQTVGWKTAFVVVGAPGCLLAAVIALVLRDPRRAERQSVDEPAPGFGVVLAQLRGKPAYWHLMIACAISAMLNFGNGYFLGFFFNTVHGLSVAELGVRLGMVTGIGWVAGILLGGYLADRASKADVRGYARVPALALVVGTPFACAAYWVSSANVSLLFLCVSMALNSVLFAPGHAMVQSMATPRSRATAIAIFLLFTNLVGVGFGPTLVGGLTDLLLDHQAGGSFRQICGSAEIVDATCRAAEATGRRIALTLASLLALWSAMHLLLASRTLHRDLVS